MRAPSGASPLPQLIAFQHEHAVECGRGLAPDGRTSITGRALIPVAMISLENLFTHCSDLPLDKCFKGFEQRLERCRRFQ